MTHVIFDMDGLLLDTQNMYSAVSKQLLAEFGKQPDFDFKMKVADIVTNIIIANIVIINIITIIIITITIIIIITRPRPAFGRLGLGGWSGGYSSHV